MNTLTLVIAAIVLPTSVLSFSYECHDNGTTTVDGTDAVPFTTFFANGSTGLCDTTEAVVTELSVSNCDQNEDIQLFFTNETTFNTVTSDNSDLFVVRCNDNSNGGFTVTVLQGFAPTLGARRVDDVTPAEAVLRTNFTFDAPAIHIAPLSTVLTWTVDIPLRYFGLIVLCSAKSGMDYSDANAISKTLIVAGCSQDDNLVGDFDKMVIAEDLGIRRLYSEFIVFKFYNSDHITLGCKVSVCTTEEDCATSCSGRKRRDLSNLEPEDYVATTTLRILDTSEAISIAVPNVFLLLIGLIVTR